MEPIFPDPEAAFWWLSYYAVSAITWSATVGWPLKTRKRALFTTWEAAMAKSSVIIPVFNQAALTQQCLRILVAQGVSEIIVVDDGSMTARARFSTASRNRSR